MIYVLDTSSWQQLFGCYRRERFPMLWTLFDHIVEDDGITSIRQVLHEIENRDKNNGEREWATARQELFPRVRERELQFLRQIYAVPRFRHIVPTEIRDDDAEEDHYEGADPYLIARAFAIDGMVITQNESAATECAYRPFAVISTSNVER